MPMSALIPALTTLLMQALDFLDKAGKIQVDNEMVATTTKHFIEAFMKSAGLDEQRMRQIQQKTMQHVMQKGGAA